MRQWRFLSIQNKTKKPDQAAIKLIVTYIRLLCPVFSINMKNYEKLLNNYHTHDIGAACRLVAGILAYHACGYNCHISALDYVFFFQKLN